MNDIWKHTALAFLVFVLCITSTWAQSNFEPGSKIQLSKSRKSIYNHINNLSQKTGLNFIYDSNIINNDNKETIPSGSYTVEEAIRLITGNKNIFVNIEGDYALIYIPQAEDNENSLTPVANTPLYTDDTLLINGKVYDRVTKEPLPYASITLEGKSMGTITNSDGAFRLSIKDTIAGIKIKISYLGYQSRVIPARLMSHGVAHIMLDPRIIPLQEVVVKVTDPLGLVSKMKMARTTNYSTEPANLTTFYREGTEYKKSISLTEAVLKVYKTGINSAQREQVKILKMRKITDPGQHDTLVAKLKSSISSALLLDIVKNAPDFLSSETMQQYDFSHTDITTLDQRRVYVVSFSQKESVKKPLYQGKLYIDAQNYALVEARFHITPKHLKAAKYDLIVKESKGLSITPLDVSYLVSYKMYNGKYHVNHVKGELLLKVKRDRKLSSSQLKVWFQMATCVIDNQATPVQKDERFNPDKIFSEASYSYDPDFWKNFNIILPEEKIIDIIENYNFNQ